MSDHCPQLLRFENSDRYPKAPFRFLNVIADHEDFEQIVKKEWETTYHSNKLLDIWCKCKNMKEPFKKINTKMFRKTTEKVEQVREQLRVIQHQLVVDHTNTYLIGEERKHLSELEKWSRIEEQIWQQKARVEWLKLGDANTKFFHAYAKANQNSKAIQMLVREDGTRCTTQEQIKQEVTDFYRKLMGSAAPSLPMVDRRILNTGGKLSLEQQRLLCHDCTEDEVKAALYMMDSAKAPGVDGFNALFFKKAWDTMGSDIVHAVQQFLQTSFMPKEINRALVTLIPKCENASSMKEFRPIACCTTLYKIISKVLANRLQGVLQDVVNESQSAFIKGRLIFDNIIISHELIKGYQRKNISPRCMIKVDLQKAYDSVEWPFVEYLMRAMGFPHKFVCWIMACLNTVSYTFSVNGELTYPFDAKKGLRQGDPISPYLFVLCMEYLNRCLTTLHRDRLFKFHPRCKGMGLVHVCFADDLLLFARGDTPSIQQLFKAFNMFCEASGLKANQLKSCIYFGGVSEVVKQEILNFSGMSEGQLPFRYLGVPLSSKKLSILEYMPLVKKIMDRIDCWASKLLTYAGRIQLIKSVLIGIQRYWSQVFLIPQKVIKLIQAACRTFLWTGKSAMSRRALVAWDKICLPKRAGGLAIVNLKLWNQAAICKMLWNLTQKKDKAWVRWIHGYYIKQRDVYTMDIPQQCSWMVRKILGAREYIHNLGIAQEWRSQTTFSIQKMYKALCGEIPNVPWHKLICQNIAPPKCVFISWLMMHNSMVTCSYLRKIGVQVDPVCCFCNQTDEEMDHLFFDCEWTGKVWKEVTEWCGLPRDRITWSREKNYLETQCRTRSQRQNLYRGMFSITTYLIWQERNLRRLQGIVSSHDVVIRQCKLLIARSCQRDPKLIVLLGN